MFAVVHKLVQKLTSFCMQFYICSLVARLFQCELVNANQFKMLRSRYISAVFNAVLDAGWDLEVKICNSSIVEFGI